jgi:SdrD B-like domain
MRRHHVASESDESIGRAGHPIAWLVAVLASLLAAAGVASAATTTAASVISGVFFQDLDRNGVQDPGEAALAGKGVVLLDASGQRQLGYTTSDASGRYSFRGWPTAAIASSSIRATGGSFAATGYRRRPAPSGRGPR